MAQRLSSCADSLSVGDYSAPLGLFAIRADQSQRLHAIRTAFTSVVGSTILMRPPLPALGPSRDPDLAFICDANTPNFCLLNQTICLDEPSGLREEIEE